jgi:hypothetical protein
MSNAVKLAFILSLPRSGSTVLSAMLDRKKGIVSPPESVFPQMLGTVTPEERADKRWLAALYLGSTFTPTPLTLEDAQECMVGSNEEILVALGKACAVKLSRDPEQVEAVVWKTPRMVSMHEGPLSTGGKFVVLRRNPHNVFESQFRVEFGKKNRNPYRFALFLESYENAFSRLPEERTIQITYDSLPGSLSDLLSFLGVEDRGEWESASSSLDLAVQYCGHMADVTKPFENTDPVKRARLDPTQIRKLEFAMRLARPTRAFLGLLRAHFDRQSTKWSRDRASEFLQP